MLWRCRWRLEQRQWDRGCFDEFLFAQRVPIRLLRARLLGERKREQPIDINKYEKSFDNRCAALVSRASRAARGAGSQALDGQQVTIDEPPNCGARRASVARRARAQCPH